MGSAPFQTVVALLWAVQVATVTAAQLPESLHIQHRQLREAVQPAVLPGLSFKYYVPSKLESDWSINAMAWESDYCSHIKEQARAIEIWLSITNITHMGQRSRIEKQPVPQGTTLQPRKIFSYYVYEDKAGSQVAYAIEPLAASLRHPQVLCDERDLIFGQEHLMWQPLLDTLPPRSFFLDLGASLYNDAQHKFVSRYSTVNITFSRILSWEVKANADSTIYSTVPKELYHAYQYFNIPANAEKGDPTNPLEIIRKIATPEDFVVFKLDIDNGPVERQFISQILEDPELCSLIDELYWELHFAFEPMVKCCWSWSHDPKVSLKDAHQIFGDLRRKGIRAHGWV